MQTRSCPNRVHVSILRQATRSVFFALAALTVGTLQLQAAPTQSSPVAISAANLLVSVNPDTNTISVFDASAPTPVKLGEVTVGREPGSVAIIPSGATAYVANAADGTVSVVDLATRAQVASVNAGAEPMALALSPNGTRLYVANSASGNLMIFNTATVAPTLVATVDLSTFGTAPRAIAVTDDGDADDTDETIFVAMFYAQLRPGKTFLEEGQDDQREGHVVAISAATSTVLSAGTLGPIANAGFNSNGQLAPAPGQVPAVPQTNPQTFTTPTAAFPNQLAGVAIQPGTGRAYVASTAASPNGPVRFNQNMHGLISVLNTVTRLEITAAQTDPTVRRTAPLNLNQGINLATTPAPRLFNSNPTAIAWRPDGSDAWITVQQSDLLLRMTVDANGIPTISAPLVAGPSTIVRVDLQSGAIPGKAPRGVVINAAGTLAYVLNYVSRSISVVDISNPTSPSIAASVQATALPAPNTPDATAQLGAEMFFSGRGPNGRLASEAWGSCASCHPNGRADNVTWMFDTGPRQTIALDGTFGPTHQKALQRILNWSAVRDEVHDFELNSRNVSGGRGLIDDDRLFLALGGASGATPTDTNLVEQFNQFTGAVGTNLIPTLPSARRDFAIATLEDGRVFIIGGRSGAGQGTLVTGADTVLEFNVRSNSFRTRSVVGFTPRHSFGAAAVRTSGGLRIYAIGGYASTTASESPINTVEEYNPATDTWRTVASLPTAIAQFGITVAGGINTAEPLQLIHVVSGNTGSESGPSVANPNPVQRFQADPAGPGTWSAFNPVGLTLRRNHGVAAVLRGVSSRVFIIGGQDASGTVLDTVEEYLAQAVTTVATPHTSLPAARARFAIAGTLSTQQIYVFGGVDGTGADQTSVFEYSVANNGPVAGPAGTPSGTWVTRANLSAARGGLQVSTPPGVVNFLPFANTGRNATQDALAEFVRLRLRPAKAPVPATDPNAQAGRTLFGTVGLVQPGFSCATCHGGANWTRSIVDYVAPPSPEVGLGLGNERVIGAELRQTATQPNSPGPIAPPQAPGVLLNVGTFTLGGGRVNEVRANAADVSQAVAPLGANGFNTPSLLSIHEGAPYYYSGLAQTLDDVLNGSQDGNGGVRHHFVVNATQRAQLVAFLKSIDDTTPIFPGGVPVPTSTTLTALPNPSVVGQTVTFTATVTPNPGSLGTMTFLDNGVVLPGGANVALVNGQALFATTSLALGTHPITAMFSGGASFNPSTGTIAGGQIVNLGDIFPPVCLGPRGTPDLSKVVVRFNEVVDEFSAEDEFSYDVTDGVNFYTVDSAVLDTSGSNVVLTLNPGTQLTPNTLYTVTINDVQDLAGNTIAANSQCSFRSFVLSCGFALQQLYQNIGDGVQVSDLTSHPSFPNSPTTQSYVGLLEGPLNAFDSYGTRLTGFILPPVSGNYNFFVSSDDGGQFWLSTDQNPANRVLVCSEPEWNGSRDWTGTTRRNAAAPENRSSTLFPGGIPLVAGQFYFFELLAKEGAGEDNCAVAWQLPGAPEPANGSSPITGAYLAALADPVGASITITQQPADQIFIISPDTLLNVDFNANDGGFTVETPVAYDGPWVYEAASGSWRQDGQAPENSHPNTSKLNSPVINVVAAGNLSLTFAHRYSFEFDGTRWDGGQVRISVNGGAFTTVPDAAFTQNGYGGNTVAGNSASELKGQPAFTAESPGYAAGFITSIASLGAFNAGDTVRVQFIAAADTNTRGQVPNWQIDSVMIAPGSSSNVTFTVGANASPSPTFYQWDRNCGSGYQPISGANGSSYTLIPTLADNGCRFRVRIYVPGAAAVSGEAVLTVVQPNTPPRFTKGPDQCIVQNAGAQTVANWATNIQAHSLGLTPSLYSSTFDTLPPGASTNGSAVVDGGILKLTIAANSQQGFFATPALAFPVESFTATFNALIGGGTCCGDRTADGWSLSFGNNISIPFPVGGEEGAGTGIIVSFDSWDNGGFIDDDAHTAPDVDIKVNGNVIAYQAFDGIREGGRAPSGPFITDPATGLPMTYKTGSSFVPVRVHLDADGTLDVDFKSVRVINNVQTGYLPLPGTRLVFGARTGGANDNHWIDDLQVESFGGDLSMAEAGQSVHFLVSNDNPGLFAAQPSLSPNGTLSYTPAINACGTANVTVVAMDDGGTAFGGDDTSDPQTFVIKVVCGPTISCSTNIITECTGGLTPVTFVVTAVDTNGAPVPVICVPPSGTGFRIGTSNVVCTATDANGSASCAFTVTVQDTQPPRVNASLILPIQSNNICGLTIPLQATSAAGVVVSYIGSAFDPCGIASFNCSPAGGTFPVGLTTVTCTASDPFQHTNTCSFTIDVAPPNQCPIASNLVVSVGEDAQVSSQLRGTDGDGDALQYNVTQPPSHGSIVLQMQTGAFTYTPTRGYCGPDSFQFAVSDGRRTSAVATVTIDVECGLRTRKEQVLAEVIALRALTHDDDDQEDLDDVIDDIQDSLADSLWRDVNHLVPKKGKKVFEEEEEAVDELEELLEDAEEGDNTLPAVQLQDFITRLVQIDRELAVISVDEAEAAGANPKKIKEDREEIAEGDHDAARGKYEDAIEHYRDAWAHAVKLKVSGKALSHSAIGFRLHFAALEDEQYIIEVSSDFVQWTPLATITADADGNIEYVDTDAANHPKRYYRVVQPSP